MIDVLNSGLSWLGDLVGAAFVSLANMLLQYFPDADPAVNDVIDMFGVHGTDMTFNVYYLLDMSAITACAGLAVTVVFVVITVAFVRFVIDVVHKVMDSIPVLG